MLQVPPLNLPISIHAPRTGSDGPPGRTTALRSDFNPRSPHGERRCVPIKRRQAITFQSTLPARGATLPHPRHTKLHPHFNPRSPHGERRGRGDLDAVFIVISIHAPRTGSDDPHTTIICNGLDISIHAPRTGSDTTASYCGIIYAYFNPRSPHGERRDLHGH